MSTSTSTLPTQPSALIRAALRDLRACEADDGYVVDMCRWHWPITDDRGREVCRVGLVGAVLAKTVGVPPHEGIYEDGLAEYGSDVQGPLLALDYFRHGMISAGLDRLGYEESNHDVYVVVYDPADPDEFHDDMHRRADYLASCGL